MSNTLYIEFQVKHRLFEITKLNSIDYLHRMGCEIVEPNCTVETCEPLHGMYPHRQDQSLQNCVVVVIFFFF